MGLDEGNQGDAVLDVVYGCVHPLDLPTFDRQRNYEIINIQYIREKNKKIVEASCS